jgi:hypothetical protein
MIDLLLFSLMELKNGANMVNYIEIMINLLVFGLVVINHGANMVKIIEIMISLLLFGLMEEWNIGLMGERIE